MGSAEVGIKAARMALNYAALRGDLSDPALEKLLEKMPAGRTSKRTSRGRLTALDDVLIEEIGKRLTGPISVHDMAASSAITSMELYQRIKISRPVTLRASDYYDAMFLVGPIGLDVDGRPMKRNVLSQLATQLHKLGLSRRQSLFHREAEALAIHDPNFTLAKESFFSPSPARYDVVRVMNALTEFNFPRSEIERALRAIMPTVKPDGLLVLGRCDDADNHIQAAIFAKTEGRFSMLRQIGTGYPLADVVTVAH